MSTPTLYKTLRNLGAVATLFSCPLFIEEVRSVVKLPLLLALLITSPSNQIFYPFHFLLLFPSFSELTYEHSSRYEKFVSGLDHLHYQGFIEQRSDLQLPADAQSTYNI